MNENFTISPLSDFGLRGSLPLVWKVFREFEAPEYSKEGIDSFYRSIHDEEFISALSAYGAYIKGELVGVIAARNELSHIALLFVDGDCQKRGIGKALLDKVVAESKAERITVNSSPFAVPIYGKWGFAATDGEQTVAGIRFTPMELILKRA